jgi:hypothetical protein
MSTICGIDPGVQGGVAFIDSFTLRIKQVEPMPTLAGKVDVRTLAGWFDLWSPDFTLVELQHIKNGQTGAMTIGPNYGRILACLELAELPHREVPPAVWMRGAQVKPGLKGKEKKEAQFVAAKKAFGAQLGEHKLTPARDGPIAALLIAKFGGPHEPKKSTAGDRGRGGRRHAGDGRGDDPAAL